MGVKWIYGCFYYFLGFINKTQVNFKTLIINFGKNIFKKTIITKIAVGRKRKKIFDCKAL